MTRSKSLAGGIALLTTLFATVSAAAAGPKIGFVLKDKSPFWAAVAKALQEESAKQGAEIVIKAPLAVGAEGMQLKMLSSLVDEHCDVVAISTLGVDEYKAPIAALVAKGTKIIIYDSAFPSGIASAQVGLDQEAIATAGAQAFVKLVNDGDEVSVLRSNGVDPLSAREKAMRDLLKKNCPKSVVHSDVYIGAEQSDEVKKAETLLSKYPNAKAVFTPYTATTLGMLRALKETGQAGKIRHVGFGISLPAEVSEAIESGALQAWVVQRPRELAKKGLEVAIALSAGKPVPPVTAIDGVVVTKDNLHDSAIQALAQD